MLYDYILWICVAVYAIHIAEEKVLDWKKWFDPKTIQFKLGSSDFFVMQGIKLIIGFCCAMVSWRNASFSLLFPALILLSAIFSHIIPAIKMRKFNPGLLTSIFLLLPVGLWAYHGASRDMILTPMAIVLSILFGALVKWSPRVFLKCTKK